MLELDRVLEHLVVIGGGCVGLIRPGVPSIRLSQRAIQFEQLEV
jgi:hypothetical protein